MVQLHVLEHGYIEATDAVFFTEDGKEELATTVWPDRSYLIEHPRGLLLWDTGLCEAKFLADPLSIGGNRKVTSYIGPWLEGLGVTSNDITYLGFSHLHIDHAGNANLFADATVLLNEREHAYAFSADVDSLYVPEDYAALRDSRTILIEDTYDIYGDGTAMIHAAPGHTMGHQILRLSMPDRRPLLLVGDAFYAEEDRFHRRAPAWNADRAETFRSMDRIERLAAETNAQIMVHHAPAE